MTLVHSTFAMTQVVDFKVSERAQDTADYASARGTEFAADLTAMVADALGTMGKAHKGTTKYKMTSAHKVSALSITVKPVAQCGAGSLKENSKHSNNRPVDLWAQAFVISTLAQYNHDTGRDGRPCLARYAQLAGQNVETFTLRVKAALDNLTKRSRGLYFEMTDQTIALQCIGHDLVFAGTFDDSTLQDYMSTRKAA